MHHHRAQTITRMPRPRSTNSRRATPAISRSRTVSCPRCSVSTATTRTLIGKYHLLPSEHESAAGPYDRWPFGRGFERFYGFLGGDTSQWYLDLVSAAPTSTPTSCPLSRVGTYLVRLYLPRKKSSTGAGPSPPPHGPAPTTSSIPFSGQSPRSVHVESAGRCPYRRRCVVARGEVWRGCRLPPAWDRFGPSFATVMGPPELPVMGPPAARLPWWSRPAVCDLSRSFDLEVVDGVPGGSCARGSRGSPALAR
jgi:hypothetical protein